MFEDAENFNRPLNNWDVSNVTSIEGMFFKAKDLISLYIIGMSRM